MLIVISLFFFSFFGLGLLVDFGLHFRGRAPTDFWVWCGAVFSSGLLLNYLILLLLQGLKPAIIVSILLSVLGYVLYFNNRKVYLFSNIAKTKVILFVYLSILLFTNCLQNGIFNGDARLIWFFHGKMIWANRALNSVIPWSQPDIYWMHPDYPNLAPGVSAQLAFILDVWNEYIPKLAVFFVLLPIAFWLVSFASSKKSFLFSFLALGFFWNRCLLNGYMDGIFAAYAFLLGLFIFRFENERNEYDFCSAVFALGIILNLKNEGNLFLLSIAMGLSIYLNRHLKRKKLSHIKVASFSVLPAVVWAIYKKMWNLNVDLFVGSPLNRIRERINDGHSIELINRSLFETPVKNTVAIIAALLIYWVLTKRKLPKSVIAILISSIIYYLGIFSVYLLTHQELKWHLATSADRTILPFMSLLFSVIYILIQSTHESASSDRNRLPS